MEENNQNTGSTNWSNPSQGQVDLPNSTASMVLGIISLVCCVILLCCYGFMPGLITSVIGLALGVSALKTYNSDPSLYTEKSYKNAKAGKLMSLISLIICAVLILAFIILIVMGVALDTREYMK